MSVIGFGLAALLGWISAEMIARQSREYIVAITGATIGAITSFVGTVAILWIFDVLDKDPKFDFSLLNAGGGVIWVSIAGALIGAMNGNRVARRHGGS